MSRNLASLTALTIGLFASAVSGACLAQSGKGSDDLAGAWRGRVRFATGAFA